MDKDNRRAMGISDLKLWLNTHLLSILGTQHMVDEWWDSKNKAFEDKSPNEVWEIDGGKEIVANYVMWQSYGEGS